MESIFFNKIHFFAAVKKRLKEALFIAYKKVFYKKILEWKAGLGTKKVERYLTFDFDIMIFDSYTLNRKCITSPSFTIYSFPSTLNFPASLALASEPK
jgi:hypothetical protein